MMATSPPQLLSLPQEILVLVLSNLEYQSLSPCSSVCWHLRRTVQNSVELTYLLELGRDGMVENALTTSFVPHSDRLAQLRACRLGWRSLNWTLPPYVIGLKRRCSAYELVGGVFIRTDGRHNFLASWLPAKGLDSGTTTTDTSTKIAEQQVFHEDLGINPRDFAVDPGQDLIVFLEEHGWPLNMHMNERPVFLHCRFLSTHEPHRSARLPVLQFTILNAEFLGTFIQTAVIEIAGDIVSIYLWAGYGRVLIWNWREGLLVFDSLQGHTLPDHTTGFSLLSPRAFILSSANGPGAIHIYTFSSRENRPPTHSASLLLPDLDPQTSVIGVELHTSPYEAPHHVVQAHQRGMFMADPEKRVYVFKMSYSSEHHERRAEISMYVRNCTFLQFLEEPDDTNEGCVEPISYPWFLWGPQATRIISGLPPYMWLRYVHGQRVILPLIPGARTIHIMDFNVQHVHTHEPMDGITSTLYATPTILPRGKIFLNDVETRLPYHVVSRDLPHQYEMCMIDAERIIGIKTGDGVVASMPDELHVYTF